MKKLYCDIDIWGDAASIREVGENIFHSVIEIKAKRYDGYDIEFRKKEYEELFENSQAFRDYLEKVLQELTAYHRDIADFYAEKNLKRRENIGIFNPRK